MRKSEAAASPSSSSAPSVSDANSKHRGSGSSIPGRSTTATIKHNATTTTTTTTTTASSVSSNGGSGRGINGTTVGNSNNANNNSVQSASREQHPLLDRQFDVVTAPLATFDTVDLSDEDEEVTTTSDTTTTTPQTSTITKSPSFTDNNLTRRESSPTDTPLTTSATASTAAGSNEIKTPRTVINTISCGNNINVSGSSSRTSTNNTNSTTTTTTTLLQKLSPIVSFGKKSDAASSSCTTLNPTLNQKKSQKKNSESSRGSKTTTSPPPPSQEHIDATASTADRTGKNLSPLHHPKDQSIRISPSFLSGNGVRDTDATPNPTRATDPRVAHSFSSDDEENRSSSSSHAVLPDISSASLQKHKPDAVSVESTRSSIGEGSAARKEAAAAAADTTAVVGATAGGASSSRVTHEFANFSNCDDLDSNTIGGSQSTASEGGGLPTPPAASVSGVSKPKELSAVEKANLLDESSSSDSDLSPTEPANSGGAYTTLASGSTPNLLRKISREPASKIKENSAQTTDFNSPEVIPTSSKRKAYERRLQRLQVKTTPINRPRSATPLSVVTLDEYTNLSSPEISPNLEKLKIVLPADQFGRPIKSPRSKENAFDFNEDRLFRHTKEAIVLQSDGSIGQSPRRIFIPPTLSPSQSPCKAAAGSPVSKLVLVSRLPAGTSPLVKSAAPAVPPLPPPLTSPPPPPPPTQPPHPTTTTATTFYSSSSTSSSTSAASTWKGSDKRWEQFDESHPQGTKKPPPQATCAVPKKSEHPLAIPDPLDKKTVPPRLGPPPPPGETSCSLAKGHREHEKRKTKVSTTGEQPTKPTLDQQHHADSRRNNNTTNALNPSHHKMLRRSPEEEEEEQILKVEIGSSDVGKAYNIELEVPAARERSDSSYSKSSS